MLLSPHIGEGSPFLLMLMPAILAAWYGGQGPGLAATALCAAVTAIVFLFPADSPLKTAWWQLGVFAAQGAFVAVLSAARDRARDALDAANEKSAQILESITDAFVALDRDLRLTYVNRAAERAIGAARSALLGRRYVKAFPGVFGSPFERECRRAIAERVPLSLEYHSESSDRWYEVRAYPSGDGGLSVYFRDITDRVRQEDQARQLAAIVESSNDAIIGKTLDGVIVTWNEGARRMYGHTAEEAVGRHISMLAPPSRRDETNEILERLRQGERVVHLETVRMRKDGSEFHVSLTVSPVLDDQGHIRGASTIARDITERKRLEEKVRETQKLESLGVLAGGVAHDFNNLLTGILGNASLAADMLPPDHPARDSLLSVVQASERAADLTCQMLAYAGKGQFVVRPVDVSALVREIVGLIQSSIPRKVRVELRLASGLPPVSADPAQVQQLVMNLVINGAEAIGEKAGVVEVTTATEVLDEEAARARLPRHELAPGAYVVLEVKDSGCGMDSQTLPRIFDPFFTTKFTGRGLGLAAVSGIVRSHRGALEVSSVPGQGTTFRIYLPAAAASEPEPRPPARAILVVDDEEIVRRTAKTTLEKYGYKVLVAESGPQAVETYRRRPEAVELVLLDLTMPMMDGEEVLRALRAIRPDVKAIVSSGYSLEEATRRFAGHGVSAFLQKPYTAARLAHVVRAALAAAA
jgi:PAS domain S-box-containing protein